MAIRLGGCRVWAVQGQTRERRHGLPLEQMTLAIRKCYSPGCPHAIHFTQCLSANCLEAGWIQIQHGLWVLGSYGANMAKAEITKVTHTREKREISDSVRSFCTRGKQTNTSRFKSAMTFTCQQIYQCRQHLYSNTAFLATKYSNN